MVPSYKTRTTYIGLVLALIVIVGAGLRLYRLDSQSLWIDEVSTFNSARDLGRQDGSGLFFGYPLSIFHPFLLHFWLGISTSDASARLLSVIFGVATLPMFYLLLRALFNRSIGLVGGMLLALNPFHIWYSQEARMYSLLLFLATLATVLLWNAVEKGAWGWWAAYGLVTSACFYTHLTAIFLAVSHGLCACLWAWKYPRIRHRMVIIFLSIGLLILPLIAVLMGLGASLDRSLRQVDKPSGIVSLSYVFFAESLGFSYGPSIYEIQADTSLAVLKAYSGKVALAAPVFAFPLFAGLVSLWRSGEPRNRKVLLLLSAMLAIPALLLLVFDLLGSSTLNPRHATICLIPYLAFIAAGLSALGRYWGSLGLAAILTLSGISLSNYYWNPRYAKEDARAAAAYLATLDTSEVAGIVISYPHVLLHYYRGPMLLHGPWDVIRPSDTDIEARLLEITSGKDQLAYVDLRAWHEDPNHRVLASCEKLFSRLGVQEFHGVTIHRFALP